MAKVTSLKDLLMLLLYAKGHKRQQCEPIRGRTRLVKMVFLFEKEVWPKFTNIQKAISKTALPDFKPYDYGPFSADVYSDLEFLVEVEFVRVEEVRNGESSVQEADKVLELGALEYNYWQSSAGTELDQEGLRPQEEFSLTELGRDFVKDGEAEELSKEQWNILDEFKARCTGTSLQALLRYVYKNYRKMTENSRIVNEILSDKS